MHVWLRTFRGPYMRAEALGSSQLQLCGRIEAGCKVIKDGGLRRVRWAREDHRTVSTYGSAECASCWRWLGSGTASTRATLELVTASWACPSSGTVSTSTASRRCAILPCELFNTHRTTVIFTHSEVLGCFKPLVWDWFQRFPTGHCFIDLWRTDTFNKSLASLSI